jgi:hypothetical protein
MTLKQFQTSLEEIKQKVLAASQLKFDLKKVVTDGSYMYDYNYNKAKYMADRVKRSASELVVLIEKIHKQNKNPRLDDILSKVMVNTKFIMESYLEPMKALPIIEQTERDLMPVKVSEDVRLSFSVPELPEEISENVAADIAEMEKCFSSGCFRSSIILCGRVIETALHRKYFEVTGNDALEKEPGIGLGKLIARMNEKSVKLDPGLPQQIHFVNQVRIFSVHTKQEAFSPSKNQAQATILYTMDVLGKLFSSE